MTNLFGADVNSSDDELDAEIQKIIAQATQETIEQHAQTTGASRFPWTDETAKEYRQLLDTDEGVMQLICDPYFLGLKDYVYDSVLDDLVALYNERRRRSVNLVVFLEGIGSGKTTKFSILQWLQWFELSTVAFDPQAHFELIPGSTIALINLSRTELQARRVCFSEVWKRFQCPFIQDYFTPNPRYTKEIAIPQNNTLIFAGTSSAMSALGYNLYGGGVDEAAFLEVIEDSKKAGVANTYDAAEEMHNAIFDRMTSRFMVNGVIPGMLVMFSSPRYPDDFLERKCRQAEDLGDDSGIFWRRRATWSAKGKKFYQSGKFFYVDTDTMETVEQDRALDSGKLLFLDNDSIPEDIEEDLEEGILVSRNTSRGLSVLRPNKENRGEAIGNLAPSVTMAISKVDQETTHLTPARKLTSLLKEEIHGN